MPRFHRILRIFDLVLGLLLLPALFSNSSQVPARSFYERARSYARAVEFDYFGWTLDAIGVKLGQAALDTPAYFSETARRQVVSDYLQLTYQILVDEYDLELIYTDPSISDPEAASADLRARLDEAYARQRSLAPLAEAVLEEQISALLAELDLTTLGQPLPPISFHMSPLPYHLIISPRDKIQQDAAIGIIPDLPLDRQVKIEEQVAAALDVSTLVVPVGGIGTYPSMVMRTTSLQWLADVISHEWIHNWLSLRPLGFNYGGTPELRTMNETTASIAGTEIAALFIRRYYPDLASAYGLEAVSAPLAPVPPGGFPRPVFDYWSEMHTTRVHVDELLAEGKIEEAEAYMEMRRQVFWENGYHIRKLNQAFFAFYGAYADIPGGAAGEDPVGPAVRALRAQSASLTEFLKTIAAMSSFEELQKAVSP